MSACRNSFYTAALCLALALLLAPVLSHAQTMGSEDYEGPEDPLPGEASTAPPTDQAVHEATDESPRQAPRIELSDGDRLASVKIRHATDGDFDPSGLPVVLHAVRPPGPLQPDNFRQVIDSWNGVTDDTGRAQFTDLPDGLARQGLRFQASTTFAGISYDSSYIQPAENLEIDLTVYDRTHQPPPIRLTQKRVLISPWEEYLVFDQFWTFAIDGDQAFDIGASTDASLARGLPLRLPMQAEGISFSGPGDHEVVNNVIYWNGVLTPDQPVTVQVRFSQSVRSSDFTHIQSMEFPVEEIQLLAPLETTFNRVPRLDDLTLRAPGFDVGSDPSAIGLPTQRDYLVAQGRSLEAGETYKFQIDGLPFQRPLGGWIALFGGLLVTLFIAVYGRREYLAFRQSQSQDDKLDALHQRRDAALDELAAVQRALRNAESDDEILDLEEEQILLRQRLALILRKINELTSDDSPHSDAA